MRLIFLTQIPGKKAEAKGTFVDVAKAIVQYHRLVPGFSKKLLLKCMIGDFVLIC